jgi:putative PIN family toxin of toxin-antitoxin system
VRLAVFDTNVLVSAGINPEGAPARLLMDWVLEDQVKLVTSPWIAGEAREVFRRAKFRRYGFPPQWLEFVLEESLRLADPAPWPHKIPDAKDAPFLALAQASGAWLVTGNLRHFPLQARDGVTVLAPSEYLAMLESR